jgi:hypothetical protein
MRVAQRGHERCRTDGDLQEHVPRLVADASENPRFTERTRAGDPGG